MASFLYRVDVLALDEALGRNTDPSSWTVATLPRRDVHLLTSSVQAVAFEDEPFACPYLPTELGTLGVPGGRWNFEPVFARHDAISLRDEREASQFKLTIAAKNTLAQSLKRGLSGLRAFLTVALMSTTPRIIWVGEVTSLEHVEDGTAAILTCEHLLARMQRPGLTRAHPRVDPRYLYDNTDTYFQAQALESGYFRFREDGFGTASTALPSVLNMPEAANRPDGFFAGGFVVIDGAYSLEVDTPRHYPRATTLNLNAQRAQASLLNGGVRRTVVAHTGSALHLDLELPRALLDAAPLKCSAFKGYDGTFTQALAHGAEYVRAFQGYPFIPLKNPFTNPIKP